MKMLIKWCFDVSVKRSTSICRLHLNASFPLRPFVLTMALGFENIETRIWLGRTQLFPTNPGK